MDLLLNLVLIVVFRKKEGYCVRETSQHNLNRVRYRRGATTSLRGTKKNSYSV